MTGRERRTARGWIAVGGQGLLLVVIAALVAGQLLGQPILLGFVETESMEPTIEAGDGFVAVPSELSGTVEPGDVIVFEAQELEGGGLTTHRVVEETDRGYVTQGDGNPSTDQTDREPHVQDGQIVATALQVDGVVVTIPRLGTAAMAAERALEAGQHRLAATLGTGQLLGSSGLALLLLGASLLAYALETIRERRARSGVRPAASGPGGDGHDGPGPRVICAGFAVLVVIAAAAGMMVPAGTESFDVVSSAFESDRPLVIATGATETVPYTVGNGGFVPVVSYVVPASDGVAVTEEPVTVGPRSETDLEIELTAPDDTGAYTLYATEYRYLHVLPEPVIGALFAVHPWLPYVAILGVVGGGTYALGRLLIGPGSERDRRQRARARRSSDSRRWL